MANFRRFWHIISHIMWHYLSNDSQNYFFVLFQMQIPLCRHYFFCCMTFSFWDMTSLTISVEFVYDITFYILLWRHLLTEFQNSFFVILQITISLGRHNCFCSTTYSVWETMVASCAPYLQCYLRIPRWASLWRHFWANFKNYFFYRAENVHSFPCKPSLLLYDI